VQLTALPALPEPWGAASTVEAKAKRPSLLTVKDMSGLFGSELFQKAD
jgi:hypothetical protein